MTHPFRAIATLAMTMALASLAGCHQRQASDAGPAEKAGKAIDDAGAKVADQLQAPLRKAEAVAQQARDNARETAEQASRQVGDATEMVGKKVEQAGEKIQDAAH